MNIKDKAFEFVSKFLMKRDIFSKENRLNSWIKERFLDILEATSITDA